MNLFFGDAKYADVMEIEAYNGALSGISLKGTEYFYTYPLSAELNNRQSYRSGVRTRYLFYCPSKLPGFVAGINRWIYAQDHSGIYVNLFIGSTVRTEVGGKNVTMVQETDYPWKEKVRFPIQPDSPHRFKLLLRIPGWARTNGCFPSDIYRFDHNKIIDWKVSVNGKPIEVKGLTKGYVQISRKWKPGDKVELFLLMPVRQVYSHPNIEATRGKEALMRGPVLYCLEGADNKFNALSTALAPDPEIEHEYRQDLLGGVTVLNGLAVNSENEPFVWPSEIPEDCPFEQSGEFNGIKFLGVNNGFHYGDTWYPTWAANDTLYSPWTDGKTKRLDGKTAWLLYSGNYWDSMNGESIGVNPPGGHYGMVFQKIQLLNKN